MIIKRIHFYILLLVAVIFSSYYFSIPGLLHTESMTYVVHFLNPAENAIQKVFDPANSEWGAINSRELSYFFNWVDAQFASFVWQYKYLFFPISHVFTIVMLFGSVFYLIRIKVLRISYELGVLLTTLLYTSTNYFWSSGFYFRSGKVLVAGVLSVFTAFLWTKITKNEKSNELTLDLDQKNQKFIFALLGFSLIGIIFVKVFDIPGFGFGKVFLLLSLLSVIWITYGVRRIPGLLKRFLSIAVPVMGLALVLSTLDRMGMYFVLVTGLLSAIYFILQIKRPENTRAVASILHGLTLVVSFMMYYDQNLNRKLILSISGYYPLVGIPQLEKYVETLLSFDIWKQAIWVVTSEISFLILSWSAVVASLIYFTLIVLDVRKQFLLKDRIGALYMAGVDFFIPFSLLCLFVLMCSWANVADEGLIRVYYFIPTTMVLFLHLVYLVNSFIASRSKQTVKYLELSIIGLILLNLASLPGHKEQLDSSVIGSAAADSNRLLRVLENLDQNSENYLRLSTGGRRFVQSIHFKDWNFEFETPFDEQYQFLFQTKPKSLSQLLDQNP